MTDVTQYAASLTARTQAQVADYLGQQTPMAADGMMRPDAQIAIYDDVLLDPHAYRAAALAQVPQTYVVGEVSWHGLSPCEDSGFTDWLSFVRPDLEPSLSLIRRSPAGQVEPNFIHTDRDMGTWTAILYLTQETDAGDGTDFWQHRWSGAIESQSVSTVDAVHEAVAWRDVSQWSRRVHVPAVWNRAVIFPAPYFHSRAIYDNYGVGDAARLTQIVFCSRSPRCQ